MSIKVLDSVAWQIRSKYEHDSIKTLMRAGAYFSELGHKAVRLLLSDVCRSYELITLTNCLQQQAKQNANPPFFNIHYLLTVRL
jgi:hypothetical protein